MNYEFERESGFINSQPSLAECLTSFPPVAEPFQSSSIKSSTLPRPTLIPPPFEQTIPSLNPGSHPRHGRPRLSPDGCSPLPTASLPPEYPWMREKKASKRSHLPTSGTTGTSATIHNGPVCFSPKGGPVAFPICCCQPGAQITTGEEKGGNVYWMCCFWLLLCFKIYSDLKKKENSRGENLKKYKVWPKFFFVGRR